MEFLLSIPLVVVIIALFAGTALLLLECFVPGVGIPGITGGILVLFAIVALVCSADCAGSGAVNHSGSIRLCQKCRQRTESLGAGCKDGPGFWFFR